MKGITLAVIAVFVCVNLSFSPKLIQYDLAHSAYIDSSLPPLEQSKMLLRKVMLTGKVSSEVPVLDSVFANRVGKTCEITRDQLRNYLNKIYVNEWEIGGTLDLPVSTNTDNSGVSKSAQYFVIHDTSFPRYGQNGFPDNIDDESWEWNKMNRWFANVTHIFVNRIGESKTITPFSDGITATKLERYVLGETASKGLYLHIELIQPRAVMKGFGKHNDADAPEPGFTKKQYDRLALLYITASVRKGAYLIPGFHACVDQGIRNSHDDPQNFELPRFFQSLNETWTEIDKVNKS